MKSIKHVLRNSVVGLLFALLAFSGTATAAPAQITRVSGLSVPHMYGGGPGNVILGMIYNASTTFGVSLQMPVFMTPSPIPNCVWMTAHVRPIPAQFREFSILTCLATA